MRYASRSLQKRFGFWLQYGSRLRVRANGVIW
jgi:hypothetical protein